MRDVPLTDDVLLDLPAVVERTKLSARTWRRIFASGAVGIVRIQGSVRVPKTELEKYLQANFIPSRNRREARPQSVEEALDRVLPRLRVAR